MTTLWILWLLYLLAFSVDRLHIETWRRRRATVSGENPSSGSFSFALRAALPIFTVLLLARTFVIDVYHVPTTSMMPVLDKGARIWVNRLAYGIRSPLTGASWIAGKEPRPGDVIVFRYPREPRTTYVKRVLAVPGDQVVIHGDDIRINGKPLFLDGSDSTLRHARVGTVEYLALHNPTLRSASSTDLELIVPPHHYFTLGDNLDHSQDSRDWGLLADYNLLGRVCL